MVFVQHDVDPHRLRYLPFVDVSVPQVGGDAGVDHAIGERHPHGLVFALGWKRTGHAVSLKCQNSIGQLLMESARAAKAAISAATPSGAVDLYLVSGIGKHLQLGVESRGELPGVTLGQNAVVCPGDHHRRDADAREPAAQPRVVHVRIPAVQGGRLLVACDAQGLLGLETSEILDPQVVAANGCAHTWSTREMLKMSSMSWSVGSPILIPTGLTRTRLESRSLHRTAISAAIHPPNWKPTSVTSSTSSCSRYSRLRYARSSTESSQSGRAASSKPGCVGTKTYSAQRGGR